MKGQFQSRAILAGTAGFSSLFLMVAAAEAQTRPPNMPASRPPSQSSTGTGSQPLPSEVQRAHRPSRPTVDIIDMLDRIEERTDPSAAVVAAVPGVVTCEAGCDGAPGKIVYASAAPAPRQMPSPLQQASLVDQSIEASPKPAAVTCLAGCFDEPAWKHPRNRAVQTPSVVMASLTPPKAGKIETHRLVQVPQPQKPLKAARTTTKAPPPVVRLASAHPPRAFSLQAEIVKKRPAKRFVAAKKVRMTARKTRHKIIRPAVQYPPRPLPAVVRVVTASTAPVRRPDAPIGPFATTIVYSEPRKVALETPSVNDLARRALRDRALRQSLATVSDDWLNKAKRDAAPAIRVQ